MTNFLILYRLFEQLSEMIRQVLQNTEFVTSSSHCLHTRKKYLTLSFGQVRIYRTICRACVPKDDSSVSMTVRKSPIPSKSTPHATLLGAHSLLTSANTCYQILSIVVLHQRNTKFRANSRHKLVGYRGYKAIHATLRE